MRAIIRDNQWVWLENITNAEEDILWIEFSVAKPGIYIDPTQLNNWDGVYRKYNRAKKRIARPLLSMLRGICNKHDLPLAVVDEREKWPYKITKIEDITEDFLPGIKLDQHQIRAIKAACKIECGIADIPTGGGKGEIIAGICKAISCPTVVIADQRIVVEQLKSRLELRDVADEIGLFYAGQKPNGEEIIVGTIQSLSAPSSPPTIPERTKSDTNKTYSTKLARWESLLKGHKKRLANAKMLRKYIKNAEMILVDECDKASSEQFKSLFRNWFKGRRRYGFSGTPFDKNKPVEEMVIQEHLGSIIARETRQNLQKIGRIIPVDYYMVAFGIEGSTNDRSAFDIAYNDWLVENYKFHRLIANICKRHSGDGNGTLILVDRAELGINLESAIRDAGLTAHFIYGKTNKKRRNDKLREFERREFDVLIGGKIVNRGLDLKGGCENLILASSSKLQSDFIQKIGRAVRHNKNGRSNIYDFLFLCNKYLYSHSRERLKTMIAAQYKTTVILPGCKIDGAELVRIRFRIKDYIKKATKRAK